MTSPEKALKLRLAARMRGSLTPAESRLWSAVRAGRLGGLRFRRQHVIRGFIVDFYCASARLAVEVDGPIHELRQAYDAARDRILEQHGIRVLRFSNRTVEEVLAVVTWSATR